MVSLEYSTKLTVTIFKMIATIRVSSAQF